MSRPQKRRALERKRMLGQLAVPDDPEASRGGGRVDLALAVADANLEAVGAEGKGLSGERGAAGAKALAVELAFEADAGLVGTEAEGRRAVAGALRRLAAEDRLRAVATFRRGTSTTATAAA